MSIAGEFGKKLKQVSDRIVTVRTGTVVSTGAPLDQTLVALDNDPSATPVEARALNFPLTKGMRVACLAYPPRGLIVLGALGPLPDPYPVEDSGWITPTLLNGWVNAGGGQNPVGYRKIGDQVFLRGFFGGGTLNTAIFVLPAGFRPPLRFNTPLLVQFATTGGATAGTAHTHNLNHATGFLYVDALGNVVTGSGHVSNGYQSLDNISFFVT